MDENKNKLYNQYSQDSETHLKEIIKEKYSNIKSNTEKLKKNITEYQTMINKLNLKTPIEIQQKILVENHGVSYANFILDPNQKYIFRVNLQTNSNPDIFLIVGIIQEQDKDNKKLQNGISYNERGDYNTINNLVKGNNVYEGRKVNIDKEIEVRIHLSQKTIKVADYPNYENVAELQNKQLILENTQQACS
ncbi:hypothetical protein ABPG72_014501 [Tetrahymena utriculariae]